MGRNQVRVTHHVTDSSVEVVLNTRICVVQSNAMYFFLNMYTPNKYYTFRCFIARLLDYTVGLSCVKVGASSNLYL
jgi:hypothetical protein